ncbi:MAG: FecR domain-containing protein [Deltaproteobacteria bacterium]|nr:FecR domain-containing protein [Deltaproteobacteria bacterium]
MRLFKYLVVLAMLLRPALAFSEDLGLMRLGLIQGAVQVITKDTTTEWEPAAVNMPLNEGDRIWVPEDGRMEIQVRGGVYVRADEKTSTDILTVNAGSAQFYMYYGHVYINNRKGGIKIVQVDTPLSSIRSYDNSIILIDVLEGGGAEVQVLKGHVYAENKEGKTRVGAGNALTIREDGSAEVSPIGQPDEWEKWNLDRDKQFAVWSESSRYLPDALHEYSSEFDTHGRWIYGADYGYVWNPIVIVVEWAPYREGRWRWIRGHYVWISHEPWGWAPYHYGRWIHVTGTGWCWVPPKTNDIYWGPGYVGWVNTRKHVGWVPLAPGEIYYGRGYYGPASVNIARKNKKARDERQYKNMNVENSATVVSRDTFGTPDRDIVRLKENPFLEQRHDFMPPAVKPGGQTVRHATKPETTPPPERIRQVKPEQIRKERKLVQDREASVFRPEHPKPLRLKQVREPKVITRKIKPARPQENRE